MVLSVSDFWFTQPMGFKARVDPSSPALCSRLRVMILRKLRLTNVYCRGSQQYGYSSPTIWHREDAPGAYDR